MRGGRVGHYFRRAMGVGLCDQLGLYAIQLLCGYWLSQLLARVMGESQGEILPLAVGTLALLALGVVPLYVLKRARAHAMARDAQVFREYLYDGVLHRDWKVNSRGELEVKLRRDTQAVIQFWEQSFPNALGGSVILLGATLWLVWIDGRVGALFFAMTLVQLLPIVIYETWARKIHNATCQAEEALSAWMLEGYHGAHVLKCYGVQSWYLHRFQQLEKAVMRWGYRAEGAVTVENVVFQAIDSLLNYGSYVILGLFVLYGGLSVAKLPLLVILAGYLFSSIGSVFSWWLERAAYQEAHRRLGLERGAQRGVQRTTSPGQTLLSCQNVTKTFGNRIILTGVSLDINSRERILIQGKNGSGKSTLLRILLGLEEPDGGSVSGGLEERHISYCLQEEAQTQLTVRDMVEQLERSQEMNPQALHRHLERFGLGSCMEQPLSQLSGGQLKRFFLSAALAKPSELLVLDEPTNHLDRDSKAYLREVLSTYPGTLVVCTHMEWPGMRWDRVMELEGGVDSEP